MSVDVSRVPVPMQGLCYQPAPTDYIGHQGPTGKYFDTDFFNTDFTGFWSADNGGRGDLVNMSDLGINFLHIYDWNPQRDHTTFLQECNTQNLFVAVPFGNYATSLIASKGADVVYKIMSRSIFIGYRVILLESKGFGKGF